jgi:hypothetical protein
MAVREAKVEVSYTDDFSVYLSFDGSLTYLSAYDAAIVLANDTTFDIKLFVTVANMKLSTIFCVQSTSLMKDGVRIFNERTQ